MLLGPDLLPFMNVAAKFLSDDSSHGGWSGAAYPATWSSSC
ncbi:MAG: hypothetical protein ACMVO3_00010 [Thalassobaculum sp.]